MKKIKISRRELAKLKKEELEKAFNEFCEIRDKIGKRLIMGRALNFRTSEKYYSKVTYQKITFMLNFFYDNFYNNENTYMCKLYYLLDYRNPCLAIILNNEWIRGYSIKDWKKKKNMSVCRLQR